MKRLLFFLSFSILLNVAAIGQDTLSIMKQNKQLHSPRKATFLSMAVPGLGQVYNKKYWKVPLVYAAIGVPLFIALDQQSKFDDFKGALAKRLDDDPNTVDNQYSGSLSDQGLRSLIEFHRKNRDVFLILTGVGYALNVVDAAVDAHFYDFDVSDDLSASFKPSVQFVGRQQLAVPSLTLSLKFTKKKARILF